MRSSKSRHLEAERLKHAQISYSLSMQECFKSYIHVRTLVGPYIIFRYMCTSWCKLNSLTDMRTLSGKMDLILNHHVCSLCLPQSSFFLFRIRPQIRFQPLLAPNWLLTFPLPLSLLLPSDFLLLFSLIATKTICHGWYCHFPALKPGWLFREQHDFQPSNMFTIACDQTLARSLSSYAKLELATGPVCGISFSVPLKFKCEMPCLGSCTWALGQNWKCCFSKL